MFKLTLKNQNGQTETIDLSGHIGEVISKLHENCIDQSPFHFQMRNARNESSPIQIHSDSDFGNGALKLLRDEDTLYDAYVLEHALSNTKEETRGELEQDILYEQYGNTEELYADIRRMSKELGSEQVTFYCPLEGNLQDAGEDCCYETDNSTLLANSDIIEEYLKKEQSPDMDMAEYVGDHANLGNKLVFAEWSVEELDGTLYGRIDCYLTEPLTAEEIERLRDAILGQNSDGLGEGFEQRNIPIEEGVLNVSFWNSSGGYFLYTEAEMDNILIGKMPLSLEVQDELL